MQSLTRDSLVKDINHIKMSAMKIFAMSIKYLKVHFMEAVKKQTSGVLETDVRYVITIPAIWDDKAKQFMREAAVEVVILMLLFTLCLQCTYYTTDTYTNLNSFVY